MTVSARFHLLAKSYWAVSIRKLCRLLTIWDSYTKTLNSSTCISWLSGKSCCAELSPVLYELCSDWPLEHASPHRLRLLCGPCPDHQKDRNWKRVSLTIQLILAIGPYNYAAQKSLENPVHALQCYALMRAIITQSYTCCAPWNTHLRSMETGVPAPAFQGAPAICVTCTTRLRFV